MRPRNMPRLETIQIMNRWVGMFVIESDELPFDYAVRKLGFKNQTEFTNCLPWYKCYRSEYRKRFFDDNVNNVRMFRESECNIDYFVRPDINWTYNDYMIYPKMADVKRCQHYPDGVEDKNLWLCEDWEEKYCQT